MNKDFSKAAQAILNGGSVYDISELLNIDPTECKCRLHQFCQSKNPSQYEASRSREGRQPTLLSLRKNRHAFIPLNSKAALPAFARLVGISEDARHIQQWSEVQIMTDGQDFASLDKLERKMRELRSLATM